MFSVLQDLTPNLEANTVHYYPVVLNLKAERFEFMESLGREGDNGLQADYRAIIGTIKNMWARNYTSPNSISQNTEHCTFLLQCRARRLIAGTSC